jgi:O-antigen/teichoic acid export membrane protein
MLKIVTVLLQFFTFYMLVNGLSKSEFALYSTVASASVLLVHFVAPGFTNLIVSYGSRDKHLETIEIYSSAIFLASVISLFCVCVVYFFVKSLIGDASIFTLLMYIFSEVFVVRLFDLGGSFWHFRNVNYFFGFQLVFIVARLIAIGLSYVMFNSDIDVLFASLLLANIIVVLIQGVSLRINLVSPFLKKEKLIGYIREGLPFALNITCKSVNTNADKIIFTHFNIPSHSIADYSLSMRLVYMAFMPLHMVIQILIPRFFKAGEVLTPIKLLKQNLKFFLSGVLSVIIVGAAIYNLSPFIVEVLNKEYLTAVPYVQLLSAFPLFLFVNMFLSEVITGTGNNIYRVKVQFSAALIFIVVTVVSIPIFGVDGAALGFYISEMVLFLCLLAYIVKKREL